jgi:DNA-binding MarR family transcriptional regulator
MNDHQVKQVREFNRFYTNIIGLLNQHLLDTTFSLPEARMLYELDQRPSCTASDLMEALNMDKGYMSRMLTQFQKKGLVSRKKSGIDGRAYFLSLTAKGKKAFSKLDEASHVQIKNLLQPMEAATREKLLQHMNEIKQVFINHQRPTNYDRKHKS